MAEPRIDIVTQFPRGTTSLENLRRTVEHADESWTVRVNRIPQPSVPGQNAVSRVLEWGLVTFAVLATALRLRLRNDLLVVHKPLPRGLVERLTGIVVAERVFLTFPNVVYATFDANYVDNPRKSPVLFERADLVHVTSHAIEQTVKRYTSGERVVFASPSVDTDLFAPADAPPGDENGATGATGDCIESSAGDETALRLGWVGNIRSHPENLELLAERLDSTNRDSVEVTILYAGGEFPADLRQELAGTGTPIELVDGVPHEQVPAVINSFDVGLAPLCETEFDRGRSSEKVREYMACGVPVLGSDVGENPHLVPEEAGILVSSPAEWDDALQTLSDPDRRARMSENAREHAVENYSIPVIAAQVRSAYGALL